MNFHNHNLHQPIVQHKHTNYHPMFVILFLTSMLPPELEKQIPRTTRNEWKNKKLENYFGYDYCETYIKYFEDVAYAHNCRFTRYTMSVAIGIKKTLMAITQNSLHYKKLLRTQATGIVQHITTLARKGFSVTLACKIFGVEKSWYNYHKRKVNCQFNVLRFCLKQHPKQLTYNEQKKIKRWVKRKINIGKNLTELYYKAMNKRIVFCCQKTFNIYAHLFGYKKASRKPKAKQKKGHRASSLFEYLHVDTTYITTLNSGVLKLSMVRDNFSKAILHYIITKASVKSKHIKQVLQETFDKYKLYDRSHEINIVSDGGAENKGEVITWVHSIKAPSCVRKITAKTEQYPHPNNMIEGGFHLFKHDFLKGKPVADEPHLYQKVDEFLEHVLHRYFGELYGITPQQVLSGEIPDRYKFSAQIKQAAKERQEVNKNFKGCAMSACQ